RQVLPCSDALHPLRLGDSLYVSMGGGLSRSRRAQPCHSLEHVELYFGSDGRLCLRVEKRRARLEKIATPGRSRLIQEIAWTGWTASLILACVTIQQRLIAILSWFIT